MNKEIIDWLLEGPAWLRYAVDRQLLDKEADVRPVLEDKSIQIIIQRLKDDKIGIPGLKTGKVTWDTTGNAYWDLFFLSDIGLTADLMGVEHEIEDFFKLQLPDGTFVTEDHHAPNYFCVSGIFLSAVARVGYKDHPSIRKYVQYILDTQKPDGWHCGDDHTSGGKYQGVESCPMDNLNILQLLGLCDEYQNDPRFDGAIDLLLEHWRRRDEKWRLSDFGIGKRYKTIEYPAMKYGILRVLDAVSLFPHSFKSDAFEDMLDFVQQKSSEGRYTADAIPSAYPEFDFGQKEEPSRWITFVVNRIEKRYGG